MTIPSLLYVLRINCTMPKKIICWQFYQRIINSFGNPIDYLLEAFNFIRESSITELSWKVLFRLAEIYYERGNYSKSEEFNTFAISVMNFIFDNIKNEKIKSFVMESSERKESYQRLLNMKKNY
jgi:hypothetical protein